MPSAAIDAMSRFGGWATGTRALFERAPNLRVVAVSMALALRAALATTDRHGWLRTTKAFDIEAFDVYY
jgi:hypothetical protein